MTCVQAARFLLLTACHTEDQTHTIPPNVYRACESVGVTQKSTCEPVSVTQETHDHNYFRTRSIVNDAPPPVEPGEEAAHESHAVNILLLWILFRATPVKNV